MSFSIGNIPWNKGKKCPNLANPGRIGKKAPNWRGGKPCIDCGKERNSYNAVRCLNCLFLYRRKENHPNWKGGKPKCINCGKQIWYTARRCKSCAKTDEKHPFWKGGREKTERRKLMRKKEYILWRTAIFMRDDYTCQICKQRGGELQADHIKPWALYPELRYAIDNGRTLCIDCHRDTETYKPNYYLEKEITIT